MQNKHIRTKSYSLDELDLLCLDLQKQGLRSVESPRISPRQQI